MHSNEIFREQEDKAFLEEMAVQTLGVRHMSEELELDYVEQLLMVEEKARAHPALRGINSKVMGELQRISDEWLAPTPKAIPTRVVLSADPQPKGAPEPDAILPEGDGAARSIPEDDYIRPLDSSPRRL